jgi:hypothetical protein
MTGIAYDKHFELEARVRALEVICTALIHASPDTAKLRANIEKLAFRDRSMYEGAADKQEGAAAQDAMDFISRRADAIDAAVNSTVMGIIGQGPQA